MIDVSENLRIRRRRICVGGLTLLGLLSIFGRPVYGQNQDGPNQESHRESAACLPDIPACRPKFNLRSPVDINNCKTTDTQSPCAWADVTVASTNYLACKLEKTGPIALCYYSGAPGAPLYTPSCEFSQEGNAAQCDCYKISKDKPDGATVSYVLINAILNKTVYDDTVASCGADGSECLNATNLDAIPPVREAPVCTAIKHKTLMPGADYISDFSPILAATKGLTSYTCPTSGNANVYAGCMTAPCRETGKIDPSTKLPLLSCTCPTYNGPNQVGNPQIKGNPPHQPAYSCTPTPYVWSSAYSATSNTLPTAP
jgi:hypothetical protein